METVNIAPTPEGYAAMTRMFTESAETARNNIKLTEEAVAQIEANGFGLGEDHERVVLAALEAFIEAETTRAEALDKAAADCKTASDCGVYRLRNPQIGEVERYLSVEVDGRAALQPDPDVLLRLGRSSTELFADWPGTGHCWINATSLGQLVPWRRVPPTRAHESLVTRLVEQEGYERVLPPA